LEEQALKKNFSFQGLFLTALAILLTSGLIALTIHQVQMSDPYMHQVLSLAGNPHQGQAIYQMNCSGCHGLDASGKVGPSLWKVSDRRSQMGLIQQVISGNTPPMPKFQASPEEMADLLSYLNTL
jgi:mono/diheme cytochrome c family protein